MTNSNYSASVLSVVSLLLIGIMLLIGSIIGFLLDERKSLAKLEMQQTMDRYILSQALIAMEGFEISAAQEMQLLGQTNTICSELIFDADRLRNEEIQAIVIRKAFRCEAQPQEKLGWNIFYVTNSAGYNGDISMLVGLDGSKTLAYLRVLGHSETAGYGTRLLKPGSKWLSGMIGRPASFFQSLPLARAANPVDISADHGGIDAISGATITARAVINIIEQSFAADFVRPTPPGK